jgi:hypothetical protein
MYFCDCHLLTHKICKTLLVTGSWYAYLSSTSQHSSSPPEVCVQGAVGSDDTAYIAARTWSGLGMTSQPSLQTQAVLSTSLLSNLNQLLHDT